MHATPFTSRPIESGRLSCLRPLFATTASKVEDPYADTVEVKIACDRQETGDTNVASPATRSELPTPVAPPIDSEG